MRGVLPFPLPAAASAKLAELNLEREAALDSQRGAQARLNNMARDTDQRIRERLEGEVARHAERFRLLSMLVSRINQWAMELKLPFGSTLEMAPVPDIQLRRNETTTAAIEAVRGEIANVRARLAVVKAAPLPREDQLELAAEYVSRRALMARPKIAVMHDALRLTWADDVVMSKTDLLSAMCWIAPEAVLAALTREIEQEPARADALPAADRLGRVHGLEATLFELERTEEAWIVRAAQEGTSVPRRGDASPAAVLGLQIAAAAQEAVA
jgi:hypothetical protein